MSVDSAIARVSQLEGMIAAANGGSPSPSATSSTSFDQQLSQATDAQATSATTSSTSVDAGSGSVPYEQQIEAAAQKYGIDPAVLKGLIKQESASTRTPAAPRAPRASRS